MNYDAVVSFVVENRDRDARDVAGQILDEADRAALLQVVEAFVKQNQRNCVRSIEHRAFKGVYERHAKGRVSVKVSALDKFKSLINERVRLGDGGGGVRWGELTVEQHRQRIDMLRSKVNGLTTTIGRHEEAIELLESSKATCLDELAVSVAA